MSLADCWENSPTDRIYNLKVYCKSTKTGLWKAQCGHIVDYDKIPRLAVARVFRRIAEEIATHEEEGDL